MNTAGKLIILTSYTFSAYFLFGTSVKLYNDRLLKYPNLSFHVTDLFNLSIMMLSGFSVIKLTMKSIDMIEKL